MKMIDIGVNLMHRSFDNDRENIIENAQFEGVTPLIITGTSEKSSIEAAKYASRYSGKLYSTAGVHPHDAKSCNNKTIDTLRRLAQQDSVVAIGECGLDYNRNFSPQDVQREWFEKQINLAVDLQMPLFLHERDAFEDFVIILKKRRNEITNAVVHCFTGTEKELKAYLDLDLHIGITGWICDERRGQHLAQLIKMIPTNRLMVETDAPFLTPRNIPDKPVDGRNEPKYLIPIVEYMANILDKEIEDLADDTYLTSCNFFGISKI